MNETDWICIVKTKNNSKESVMARVLNPLPNNVESLNQDELTQLWWDERTKVGMMADKHIENALLKLQGLSLSNDNYVAPVEMDLEELRAGWITVLRKEQMFRQEARLATKVD